MHPSKVVREKVCLLTDLPNVAKATEGDLRVLGIETPDALVGRCAYQMFEELCQRTGVRHDPCMIDVFLSITRFMAGEAPRPWWDFTKERKAKLTQNSLALPPQK